MKKILLTLLAFMATVAVNAEQISKQQALQKAQQFMPGKQFGEARSSARSAGSSDEEPFYVFNADGNQGFVIVSGDDRTTEILGYSTTGTFDMEKMPDNLKWWLDSYARQIEALGNSAKPAQKAKTRGAASRKAIAPLIKTQWNQYYPYNWMCPDRNGKDWRDPGFDTDHLMTDDQVYYHSVAGCVATAMAQIMYYYQYPKSCQAIPEYTTRYGWNMKALPAITFDWASMKKTYTGRETDASATAVATLFRYCGQAVEMNYSLGGSSASLLPYDMAEVFGYSKNAKRLSRSMYSSSDWEDMIYNDISEKHPVIYGGSSISSGHQFIVDGYDGSGLFHMIWGWSGMGDGYYVLSLANPDELGAGGGSSLDGYSKDQHAIIGLKPGKAGEVEIPQVYGEFDGKLVKSKFSRTSASEDFTGISLPGFVFFQYENTDQTDDCTLEKGWGLYKDGTLLKVLGVSGPVTLNHFYNADLNNSAFSFGKGLADGQYQFRQMYRLQGSTEWLLCKTPFDGYYGNQIIFIEAIISGNNLTLRKSEQDEYTSKITVNNVSFSPKSLEVGKPVEVTVNLTNNGDSYQELVYLSLGDVNTVVCGSVEPGQTGNVKLHLKPTKAGTMPLKVSTEVTEISTGYYGKTEKVLWSESVTVEAAKPQSLSATVTTPGLVKNVLTGTTLRVNASITNNGSSAYENGILLRLFDYISGSMVREKSVSAQIKPGKTKDVEFTIADLDPGVNYFAYLYYYSAGSEIDLYVVYPFTPTEVPGDLTGDFVVDKNDIAAIIQLIMVGKYNKKADLNNDKTVNAADLVLLIKKVP